MALPYCYRCDRHMARVWLAYVDTSAAVVVVEAPAGDIVALCHDCANAAIEAETMRELTAGERASVGRLR